MYSWNFNLIRRISLISVIVLLCNCGGGMIVTADPFTEAEEVFSARVELIIKAGGVADIGIGTSATRNHAKDKAKIDAQKNLAEIFATKIQNVTKKFEEELGEDTDVEINEAFSSTTKKITSETLNMAMPIGPAKYLNEKKDGKTTYTCYIIVGIQPGVLNQSFMSELKNKNKKTYERFRASQAFEEMDAAMKDYEAQQASE